MIIIKKEKESLVHKRHPWLYSGAIAEIKGDPDNGDIVQVCSTGGRILCHGFYSPGSIIAVRIISFEEEALPQDWIQRRIIDAYQLRKHLCIPSNAYRLVNAEGDFIPGLIVDVYNTTIVVRPLIKGIERNLGSVTDELWRIFPGHTIYIKRDEYSARKEGMTIKNGYLKKSGEDEETGDDTAIEIIEENGLFFSVDIVTGQKTGFYCDLRDARIFVSRCCQGKTVLNLFSYTGAFAIHAANGGAKKVVSVEQSQKAIDFALKNMDNNPGITSAFEWIKDDVFHFLPGAGEYDIIICDPPPFARKRQEVKGALKGYRFLHRNALTHLPEKGWLFTFSCSSAVTMGDFTRSLYDAALQTGREIQIIREFHASPDHPYSLVHPEGEYLKGLALYVQ